MEYENTTMVQKYFAPIKHKFNIGDLITFYGGEPFKIIKIKAEINGVLDYLLLNQNGEGSYYDKKYVDENARLWTAKDAMSNKKQYEL